ncbi:MAG: ribokinase [Cyanobacteria bacterium QH_9_48_43]|jgi:sugar/nucleoside kinase (ribokinase family)|nr:MAG: ribokinase [Cyanobacteria bacterium QH_9_48_43]PSO94569.1 MAG: ribokinase [Cyanobacteria bacterium SW_6_48_11]
MTRQGLFIGVVTLDLIYLSEHFPEQNQKMVASDCVIAAGGPATNASVTFSHLGNQASLLGVVGNHPTSHLIRADLEQYGISIRDLDANRLESPPVSSIIITRATGDRAVMSINATHLQASVEQLPAEILAGVEIVLIDGHQMAVSEAIAQQAQAQNIPVAIDGGSWKPGFEKVLPFVDYAIASANFYPPDCHSQEDVFTYLSSAGITHIAITQGEKTIPYRSHGKAGQLEAPQVEAIDTSGAGDIFHGAFCHYILRQNFPDALASATQIASRSCQFFGSRRWMSESD